MIKEMKSDIMQIRSLGVIEKSEIKAVHEKEDAHEVQGVAGEAWDDLTGDELDPTMVREAREKEVKYVKSKVVWAKIKRTEAIKKG